MASEDSEITLGTWHLLGLFLLLAGLCGVFFSIGYSVGKSTAREQALAEPSQVLAGAPTTDPSAGTKPSAAVAAGDATQKAADAAKQPDPQNQAAEASNLTFYKAVQQGPAASEKPESALPARNAPGESPKAAASPSLPGNSAAKNEAHTTEVAPRTPPVTGPGTIVVQIAALTREDDAIALAGALRKKGYDVFVVNNPATHDKFYHVQVGPFTTLPDANAMKARLTEEGYNPILKK